MLILGYIFAVVIGVTLGLIGGGGSILTVPVMVYAFDVEPVPATAYSLFIVGITSLVGAFSYMKKKEISYLTAIVFAVPAFIAVYATRKFIVPAIPDEIFTIGTFLLTKNLFIMLLFALLMLMVSVSMIKNKKVESSSKEIKFNYPLIIIEGVVVGVLTGLVGAGGGFLIIPALVLLAKLPMKMAVGTSLLIIAAKSLIGFVGDVQSSMVIEWNFILIFSLFSLAGILLGGWLSKFISSAKLKPAFGWFVLVMGFYIIGKELTESFNLL